MKTLSLALAAALALPAARAATTTAADSTGRLEEVVVTAERRTVAAGDVAIGLSVVDTQTLADAGVTRINDLASVTPSLEVEPAFGSGQPQFRLRGVGFIDYTSNNSSPVTANIDGVPLPFPIQTQGQLFDLSRVEVLRGPQGTLYGRNTTGGAINFISNTPTRTTEAGVTADVGSHGALIGEGYLSGPVGGLTGRLAVATEQGGAWQTNRATGERLGDKDKLAARGQLRWDGADGASVALIVHGSRDRSDAYGLQLLNPFSPATDRGTVIPADTSPYATGWSLRPGFAQAVGIAANRKPGVDNDNAGATLTVVVPFATATLTSISAYNHLVRRELGDWDATSYVESDIYFRSNARAVSEELRLASNDTGSGGWLAGAYYSREQLDEQFYGDFAQRLGGAAETAYGQSARSFGLFGQGHWTVADHVSAVLGLRYEDERRDLDHLSTLFAVGDPPDFSAAALGVSTFNLSGGVLDRTQSHSDVSGKAALEYRPEAGRLYYASVSRGTKSGGFTAHNTLNAAAVDPFQPETLTAYEIGAKLDLNHTLRLDAAVFHYAYEDQQILSKVYDTTTASYIGRFVNAPRSRIDGGEVELTWRPWPSVEVNQYVGYKEGKYTATILSSDGTDFNGRALDFPKLSLGGGVAVTREIGGYQIRPEINYSYHDTYPQLFLLGPEFTVDSYVLANASLTLSPADGSAWKVALWAHNLFNRDYVLTKNFFLPGTNVAARGEPTTVGIRVSYTF